MAEREKAWTHALRQPARLVLAGQCGDTDQADDIAQTVGLRDVMGTHLRDAFGPNRGEIDPRAEADRRQDRQLVCRVHAFDIELGIGLGKALGLRVSKHRVEIGTGALHLRQDEIARAVQDAVNPIERIGRGPFAQALEHGNAAGNRCLEGERRTGPRRQLGQFQPVMRNHGLVCGDQSLALAQSRPGKAERRAVRTADQFHHHVDVRPAGHRLHIVGPGVRCQVDTAILAALARRYRDDIDGAARSRRDHGAVLFDQPDNPGPDRAESCQRDAQWFRHGSPLLRHGSAPRGPRPGSVWGCPPADRHERSPAGFRHEDRPGQRSGAQSASSWTCARTPR